MMFGPCYIPATHNQVPHVAVALGYSDRNREYLHSAILYRAANGQVFALDFDLAGNVTNHPYSEGFDRYAWAVPQFPELILPQVAAFCEALGAQRPRFTYAFLFGEDTSLVDDGLHFVIQGGSEGFTCATFVLAVFHSLAQSLLQLDSWQHREEDLKWQQDTLKLLKKHKQLLNLNDDSLKRREAEIGCLRFTPQDAIGACRVGNHPTEFLVTKHAGSESKRWLDDMHRLPSIR